MYTALKNVSMLCMLMFLLTTEVEAQEELEREVGFGPAPVKRLDLKSGKIEINIYVQDFPRHRPVTSPDLKPAKIEIVREPDVSAKLATIVIGERERSGVDFVATNPVLLPLPLRAAGIRIYAYVERNCDFNLGTKVRS